jgi:[protein-PII] uridylyltransferase
MITAPSDASPMHSAKMLFDFERQRLAAAFRETHDAETYLREHSAALDAALVTAVRGWGLPAESLALIAVGGYGRRELFPYSDIDVLILGRREALEDKALRERIGSFVTALWELGLTVGASVRSEQEFLDEALADVSVSTTYLESRLLWGSEPLYREARERFVHKLDPRRFFRDKMLELNRRHQKFEDTPYSLEPNIKESPGGLRDLQVFLWCAQAAGLADSLEGMRRAGLVTQRELSTLRRCWHRLNSLRVTLHLLAGRHEDRLLFDVQERLAKELGVKGTAELRPSEAFMKRYYLNAKSVVQMSVIQIQTMSDELFGSNEGAPAEPLESAFAARGEEMDIVADDVFEKDPNAMLRVFYVYHSHPELTRFSTRLLRALWHAVPSIGPEFRRDPKNQRTFLDILKMPKGTYHSLKLMNAWGVLGRFVPEFRHVIGQMQHDLYHIFTVDQHTLRVVRNIRRFGRSEFAHEYPLCSQIMSGLRERWRLTLAGLFHDTGKGLGGQHAEIGARKMAHFCRAYHLDRETTDFLVFLVREHLTMSRTAQREDISDPEVVRRFVKTVGTKERLDALYLLTVADIRATGPKVWTPWKGALLETLYRAACDMLQGKGAESTSGEIEARRRKEALELIAGRVPREASEKLWNELDVVYFMRHSAEEIAWHSEVIDGRISPGEPIVEIKRDPKLGGMLVLIYMKDCRGLFMRAVAGLGKFGLSVLDARIHTTKHGWALDTFLVVDQFERHQSDAFDARFRSTMTDVLTGRAPMPKPPKGKRSRRSQHFPTRPSVTVLPDESGRDLILTLVCTDRLGLLLSIAQVFDKYGVDLHTAKIATLGERAEDIFLIGPPAANDDSRLLAMEADLIEAVAPPDTVPGAIARRAFALSQKTN